MFTIGALGVFFTHISTIEGQSPTCQSCDTPLPRRGHATTDHTGYTTFWTIHCPACRQGHIVWNRCYALPEPPPEPSLV